MELTIQAAFDPWKNVLAAYQVVAVR